MFLDRDGVINIDHAYVCTQEEFQFIDGIFDLCRRAKELDYLIFVITNQAGIGRGYYTEFEFLNLTDWMCGVFKSEGASIDKVYFCPFHPEHGVGRYKIDSPFRKPGPGMILQAVAEFHVDLKHSVLVGDKESDIGAGLAAGVGCNLLYRPVVNASVFSDSAATAVIGTLAEASPFLVSQLTQ
ncbi:MAG: HAD family hydrolase [Gallionella sp.]|nr:HAD family hydrolase [Gallionella sp.]